MLRKKESGQGLLEFVLVFFLLLMVVFGVLDLGRIYFAVITIDNAAREGARYLTLHPKDNLDSYSGTIDATLREAQGSLITLVPGNVIPGACRDVDDPPGCDSGFPVQVTVTYSFRLITGWFLPSPVTLRRTVRMMVP